MKSRIIDKLNNNNFQFTEAEITIISKDKELFSILVSKITSQELFNQYGDILVNIIESITDEDFINIEKIQHFHLYYTIYILRDALIYDDELVLLNEEQQKIYLDEVRKRLINNTLPLGVYYTIPLYFLKMVLEEKKYEYFKKFNSLPYLDKSLEIEIKKFINETTEELPPLFGNFCEEMGYPYEKYPIQKLYQMYMDTHDKDISKAIIEKIIKNKTIDIKVSISLLLFYAAGYDINNPNIRDQIFNMLLDRGILSDYLHDMTYEEFLKYKSKILNIIYSSNNSIYFDYYLKLDIFKEDEDLLIALIKNKKIGIIDNKKKLYDILSAHFDELIDDLVPYLKEPYIDIAEAMTVLDVLIRIPNFNDYVYNYLLTHDNNYICSNGEYLFKSGILERCINENQEELFKRILTTNGFYIFSDFTKKMQQYLLNLLKNDSDFLTLLLKENYSIVTRYSSILEFCFILLDEDSARVLIEKCNHLGEAVKYTKNIYEYTKDFLCKDNGIINVNHLDYLAEHFGYDIIRYIKNPEIQAIIDLDDDYFYKITALFEGEFTYTEAITLYDALRQKKFSKDHPEIIDIYAHIKHSIEDKNDNYKSLVYHICRVIDDKFYEKNPQIEKHDNPIEYLYDIIIKLMEGGITEKEEHEYYDIIHTFANYYIAYKREEYRSSGKLERDCFISYEYDFKDLKSKFIKYSLLVNHRDAIVEKLISNLGVSQAEAIDIIQYYVYKRTSNSQLSNISEKESYENMIKSNIKALVKIANEYIEENNIEINHNFKEAFFEVKKNYVYSSNKRVYSILSNLNIEQIKKFLLSPEKENEYQLLLSLMKKYKLHLLPEYFNNLLESIDLTTDITDIAEFINCFYKIIELKKRYNVQNEIESDNISLNAVDILENASTMAAAASIYSNVLTKEDAILIRLNPKPNSATGMKSKERMKIAANQTIKNFQRTVVNVPTFNEIINFKSGEETKSIRVIVGNFTHPSNLTHGERTGACMRIGGVGESLFYFCLNNEHGFHIRFEDPITGQYISRVSCFRNGNTIFQNELRESRNPELYSNSDIIEANKIAGELLIKMSKDSSLPIDNVFVHRAYATLKDYTSPVISFHGEKIQQGLPHFYSDISSFGLLMASSSIPCKDIIFSSKLPEYLPAREVPYMGTNCEKIASLVNRVNSIKRIMAGENIEVIEPLIDDPEIIKYGIVSQDFYVYIDQNGEIHYEVIEIDPRAKEELKEAILKIKEQIIKINIPSYSPEDEEQEKFTK